MSYSYFFNKKGEYIYTGHVFCAKRIDTIKWLFYEWCGGYKTPAYLELSDDNFLNTNYIDLAVYVDFEDVLAELALKLERKQRRP